MDKFVARENIQHFRDRLETETDQSKRSRLHRLLVEEEDKLGRSSQALDVINVHIANGRMRLNRQHALIASMERDGHDITHALTLLNALNETLLAFEDRREMILIALNQSGL